MKYGSTLSEKRKSLLSANIYTNDGTPQITWLGKNDTIAFMAIVYKGEYIILGEGKSLLSLVYTE